MFGISVDGWCWLEDTSIPCYSLDRDAAASLSIPQYKGNSSNGCDGRESVLLSHVEWDHSLQIKSPHDVILDCQRSSEIVEISQRYATHDTNCRSAGRLLQCPSITRQRIFSHRGCECLQETDQTDTARHQQVPSSAMLSQSDSINLDQVSTLFNSMGKSFSTVLITCHALPNTRFKRSPSTKLSPAWPWSIRCERISPVSLFCHHRSRNLSKSNWSSLVMPMVTSLSFTVVDSSSFFFYYWFLALLGDSLRMEPVLAHPSALLCLETSRISTEKSNLVFTNCEMILSASEENQIHIWDLTMNASSESIELRRLLTVVQEKNISLRSIAFLLMSDNFLVANYSDQFHLHLWQLIDISIRTTDPQQWGIVEHPTKGRHHGSRVQGNTESFSLLLPLRLSLAISSASKLKLFASADVHGTIKLWDKTNSLLREISLDRTLGAIEFLTSNGELIVAYQNNIHLILPADYLVQPWKSSATQPLIIDRVVEDNRLQVTQPLTIPYQSLPVFHYTLKRHHVKQRLERFERQLAGLPSAGEISEHFYA